MTMYRGLYRYNGYRWEAVTWRPGHEVFAALPDYLYTYDARTEYPELVEMTGAPYWAGLWYWTGETWRLHRSWQK